MRANTLIGKLDKIREYIDVNSLELLQAQVANKTTYGVTDVYYLDGDNQLSTIPIEYDNCRVLGHLIGCKTDTEIIDEVYSMFLQYEFLSKFQYSEKMKTYNVSFGVYCRQKILHNFNEIGERELHCLEYGNHQILSVKIKANCENDAVRDAMNSILRSYSDYNCRVIKDKKEDLVSILVEDAKNMYTYEFEVLTANEISE